jgi:hypothetical protein
MPKGSDNDQPSPDNRSVQLSEYAHKKAGDQGILLKPLGSHDTDPFVSQDPPLDTPVASTESSPGNSSSTEASPDNSSSDK